MSLNHFSSPDLLPETLWWTTTQQQQHPSPIMEPSPKLSLYRHPQHPPPSTPTTTFNFNLNHNHDHDRDDDQESCLQDKEEEDLPKEPMFEKPLTPSDVGKLNRLVIPKQHAEKYFPLGGDSVEKGLLLAFEDDLGKSWRFRYSYWNSSQSYVLTKGWSRFVKEKHLDAGDVVLFERHRIDRDRLFIGWRRRAVVVVPGHDGGGLVAQGGIAVAGGGVGNGWTRVFYNAQAYPAHHPGVGGGGRGGGVGNGPGFPYQPDCLHAGGPNVHNKRPTTPSGNGRRSVRLFGVNLECGPEDYEPATPDGSSSISSQGQGQGQGQAHYQYFSTSNHQHHMDMNMCRDVNQMRYQQYHHQ